MTRCDGQCREVKNRAEIGALIKEQNFEGKIITQNDEPRGQRQVPCPRVLPHTRYIIVSRPTPPGTKPLLEIPRKTLMLHGNEGNSLPRKSASSSKKTA